MTSVTSSNSSKLISSSQIALHGAERISGSAEKIVNNQLGLVSEVRASKQACDINSPDTIKT